MIARDDLRAAVAAGVVTEPQAVALLSLAQTRGTARADVRPGEEPFELFRGFNEIFVVTGLAILAFGWQGLLAAVRWWGVAAGDGGPPGVGWTHAILSLGGLGLVWLLSEYFIRRRRMVAPAIALSILFGLGAFTAAWPLVPEPASWSPFAELRSFAGAAGAASVAGLLHFRRFRVPFTLAQVALGALLALVASVALREGILPTSAALFELGAGGAAGWVVLALGLALFALAMRYDMTDPHRVTRRAANGFWLHVVAAPAIVNILALSLLADPTPPRLAMLAALLALFALVAVVIDRRSFLVAGAGYAVALAGYLGDGAGLAGAVLALGAALLLLGALWEPIRRAVLRRLGPAFPRDRLPPAA